MKKFCQPTDYIYRGRNVWFNPAEVTSITHPDGESYEQCDIQLKDGRKFRIAMRCEDAAEKINAALKEEK